MPDENIALPIHFPRRFQLWSYAVSHSLLLLRSTKNEDHPSRLDVLFRGVSEVKLPRSLTNVSIGLVPDGDPLLDELGVRRKPEIHAFSVTADDYDGGFVVAWSVHFAEDDLDFDDPCAIEERTYWRHVTSHGGYE